MSQLSILSETSIDSIIYPSDTRGDALFGRSLSIFENSMVVGAPGDNTAGFEAGAVFIYDLIEGTWSERGKLIASSATSQDKFGISVDIYENTVVVGAVNKFRIVSSVGVLQAGAVYTFLRNGNLWSENQMLLANDGQAYDHFGISVSLYENSLIIGASDDNLDEDTSSGDDLMAYFNVICDISNTICSVCLSIGSVYLFIRSTDTSDFIQQDKIHSADAADRDKFGFAVSLWDNAVAVGAYQDDDQGTRSGNKAIDALVRVQVNDNVSMIVIMFYISGSVYIYDVGGSSFNFQQKLTAYDHDGGDNNERDAFGFSISLHDSTLAVSAFFDDDSGHESGNC